MTLLNAAWAWTGVAWTGWALTVFGHLTVTAPVADYGGFAGQHPIGARLSPDGAQVAFIVDDSIFVASRTGQSPRAVAGGVALEAQFGRKQLIWSPDSRFLLFRRGTPPRMNYAVVQAATGEITDVLPESMDGRLRTFGNIFTGPPVWSPSSDRIAFLAGLLDELRSVNAVYVATRDGSRGWAVEVIASDSLERTAVGWGAHHIVWASRASDGSSTVTVASMSGDSVGAGIPIVMSERTRITGFLPAPDGLRFLVTRLGSAPQIIDIRAAPRIVPSELPREASLDSYLGWASDTTLVAFGYPSRWRSELSIIDVPAGRTRQLAMADAMLTDGTLAIAAAGVRVVFGREDGSHPRSYASMIVTPDGIANEAGSVTPARFEPRPDPWSTRIIGWRAEDGTALEAQLLTPAGNPDGGVPPTIIVPYGGYRNTALTHSYFLDVLLREMLNDGWQVIRPNTRAADVLQQNSGYGAVQLADTRGLVDSLAARGLLDPSRVAVVGHSHGGSLAYYYATHSRAFCAVVAVNGRADWVMQAEYEGDGLLPGPLGAAPSEDPALYAAASPLPNAEAVTAPMLLVAGVNDGQILPSNATAMADSLRAYSRPFELLVFENEGHQIDLESNRSELIRRARATLAACRPR